jgi:hypothetical protein
VAAERTTVGKDRYGCGGDGAVARFDWRYLQVSVWSLRIRQRPTGEQPRPRNPGVGVPRGVISNSYAGQPLPHIDAGRAASGHAPRLT